MATFESAADLVDEAEAKKLVKRALDKVTDKGSKFLYFEKFPLGTKQVALVLVDYAPMVQAQVKEKFKKTPAAAGICRINAAEELLFEPAAGNVKLAELRSFLKTVTGARSVADGAQPAAAAEPAGGKPKAKEAEDAPPRTGAKPAANPELLRRVAALAAAVKALPPDRTDALESPTNKLRELVAKGDAAGAEKLLALLEPMLARAQAQESKGIGDLGKALAKARADVTAARKRVPDEKDLSVADDLSKSKAWTRFEELDKAPSAIPDAATVANAAAALVAAIDEAVKQVADWKKAREDAKQALVKDLQTALQVAGKPNAAKVNDFQKRTEYAEYTALSKERSGYKKVAELKQKQDALSKLIAELGRQCKAWDDAVATIESDLKAQLDTVPGEYRSPASDAVEKSAERAETKRLAADGKTQYLDLKTLNAAGAALRKRATELIDLEARRYRAGQLHTALGKRRVEVATHHTLCVTVHGRAIADPGAVALSFREPAWQNELDADRDTAAAARDAAQAILDAIDLALPALAAATPPPTPALDDADKLLVRALQPVDAADKRIKANTNKTTPKAIESIVYTMTEAAGLAPNFLSNNRRALVQQDAKKNSWTKPQVTAGINARIAEQHNPKLRDWFKVLGFENAKGGNLKIGKVGDLYYNDKRTDVHLSLYLANVAAPPPLAAPIGAILNALLPPVVGHVGTHVTLEAFGQIAPSQNPHYFHGAPTGVANGLAGHREWPRIEGEMRALLAGYIAEKQAMIQQHINRGGRWPGE